MTAWCWFSGRANSRGGPPSRDPGSCATDGCFEPGAKGDEKASAKTLLHRAAHQWEGRWSQQAATSSIRSQRQPPKPLQVGVSFLPYRVEVLQSLLHMPHIELDLGTPTVHSADRSGSKSSWHMTCRYCDADVACVMGMGHWQDVILSRTMAARSSPNQATPERNTADPYCHAIWSRSYFARLKVK